MVTVNLYSSNSQVIFHEDVLFYKGKIDPSYLILNGITSTKNQIKSEPPFTTVLKVNTQYI